MEKDMKRVVDYETAKKLDMLRYNCLNNSATLIAGSFANGLVKVVTPQAWVMFAKAMFDESKDFVLNYDKELDNRAINKGTGKVEVPIGQKGTMEHPLTEKDEIG